MQIVNETGQEVYYSISYPGTGDCGTIPVDGYVDLPAYDNQPVVYISASNPTNGQFSITIPATTTGEQVEMALVAE
jgi:hypothetical protein